MTIQLEADLLSLLFDNITRLDETNESDRAGLYHILSLVPTKPTIDIRLTC